ncbi:solute carrier family 22 member 7-like [Hemicordylus capensis]|uniref:solute carrier family 22 member 7-like n=1 Tax=Hemicordylus capensis TaxID=884348 RepID=UPI002303111C|nr:solute carrier family 22 member 7-like [Hemicordylus capensis]
MRFEDLLREVDGFGKYQILVFLMLCLPRLVIPMHFLLHNFISASPSHHCAVPTFAGISNLSQDEVFLSSLPQESDGVLSSCKMFFRPQFYLLENSSWEQDNTSSVQNCQQGWIYDDSQYISTTATEWNLVCENKGLNQAIATFFFIGVTFGAVLFGYLSDRFGRRRILLLSFIVTMLFGTLSAFSTSYVMFIIMRSLCGVGLTGISIISIVLAVEWTDIKHRTFCGTISGISWSVGYMLLALVAYLIRTWRWLLLAVTSPCLICIVIWRWIPESARWLLTKKEVEKAHSYLSRCAEVNGKKDFCSKITPEVLQKTVTVDESRTYFYWNLVKTPKLRKTTLCSSIVWFGVAFTYYGISLNIHGFSLDPYLTQFMFGAIEIPAKLGVYFVLDHIGRRHCQAWTLIITGSLIALNTVIPEAQGHALRSAVAILGKGFSEASFTTVFLYTAELYPTVLRQSGIGCCSFVARLASSLAPLIMLLEDTWKYFPPTIFSLVAGLSGTVAFVLPETTNVQLPETIEDVENDSAKVLGTPVSDQSMDGEIAHGLMSQTSTDAPLSQPQEVNSDSDRTQHQNNALEVNGMHTSGC